MKLQYYRGTRPNFGDELNPWLWPQLLPSFLDDDDTTLFIGIGSILGAPYSTTSTKIVFGTGYVPSYHDAPNVSTSDWDIFFVRGPRTTRALGLADSLGIGDAAILIRALDMPFQRIPETIGFMPHWESMPRGNWENVCKLAGIRLIDPRQPVERVLADILSCKVLLAEAMHGAIVADALRVPWIPLLPLDSIHREKWFDWAEALGLNLVHHRLWPSSAAEIDVALERKPFLQKIASGLTRGPAQRIMRSAIVYAAAERLHMLAKKPWCLSEDRNIERATDRMQEQLKHLQMKYHLGN